jgi:hypothetical protein
VTGEYTHQGAIIMVLEQQVLVSDRPFPKAHEIIEEINGGKNSSTDYADHCAQSYENK